MIFGRLLFDRDAISKDEHNIVRAANKTALNMYRNRYDEKLRYDWDVPVDDVTLKFVEDAVIESIKNSFEKIKGTLCLSAEAGRTNQANREILTVTNQARPISPKIVNQS